MSKASLTEDFALVIKPIINPFWAFALYLVTVHYFCFSLWPLVWWKICVVFDLLDQLNGREFLDIASRVSFSTGAMMLFFFFSAGYNTTNIGATKQVNEPFRIYSRVVDILDDSWVFTVLVVLLCWAVFFIVGGNNATEYLDGTSYPDLEVLASEVFPDFALYYEIAGDGFPSIYLPFTIFSIGGFAGIYFFLLMLMINYKFPFFILIEPLNIHFWQRIKPRPSIKEMTSGKGLDR